MVDSSLDYILAILENPTRRKILKKLSRERHYPLQLSKELKVSQQAIMKHLKILEDHQLVKCKVERSDLGGPDRKCYVTNHQFSVIIDFAPNLFNVEMRPLERDTEVGREYQKLDKEIEKSLSIEDPKKRLSAISQFVQEVSEEIEELEGKRSYLLGLKDEALEEAHTAVEELCEDYDERRLLYHLLDEDDRSLVKMSEKLNLRERVIKEMLRKLVESRILTEGGGK